MRGVGARQMAAADGHGLEQRIFAMRDRGDVEHRIALHHAVIADIFAVRAFRLDMPGRIEKAFDHIFGVGRDMDVAGDAFHHRHRLPAHGADDVELVHAGSATIAARKSAGCEPTA